MADTRMLVLTGDLCKSEELAAVLALACSLLNTFMTRVKCNSAKLGFDLILIRKVV